MPDKKDFGYSFPCDGPGRGGTCDISAWDAYVLPIQDAGLHTYLRTLDIAFSNRGRADLSNTP